VIVHCPGAHAFFDRSAFDLEGYQRAGVLVALGTDSLAGNTALDMGEEVALLRESHPALSPEAAFEMATESSARALGLGGKVGTLAEGAFADMVLYEAEGEALERITSREAVVQRVWVGGLERSL
jgi:cytosine/adenosine deaminase-related metal-dependent hydrolase